MQFPRSALLLLLGDLSGLAAASEDSSPSSYYYSSSSYPSTSTAASASTSSLPHPSVPSLSVPACPAVGSIRYTNSVPPGSPFPPTEVSLCYTATVLRINFTALDETNFFYNGSFKTNDPIYEYEVMEAFLFRGSEDPRTYFEFEVAPDNVTFNSFIYNPSKVRADGAPFDGGPLRDPIADGITARTRLDRKGKTWNSVADIPLGLFNVDDGKARGTRWRMNFFRTVVSPKTFPNQTLGAWSPPNKPSFHITPYFGHVTFV